MAALATSSTTTNRPIAYIQHHPARAHRIPALVDALGLETFVVADDEQPLNPWRGYQRCLTQFIESGNEHGVIIQDDVQLCENFGPTMKLLAGKHETPVVLFLASAPERVANLARRTRRDRYVRTILRTNEFMPVVGVLWPREKAIHFMEWASTAKLPGWPRVTTSDDACAGRWSAITRQTITFTVPSLVEHCLDTPSLVGNDKKGGRVAQHFHAGDGLALAW